jgi:hypothetical protein
VLNGISVEVADRDAMAYVPERYAPSKTAHERSGCAGAVAEASRLLALDIFPVQRFGARSSSGLMRSTALLVLVVVLTADSARWPHRDGSGCRAVGLGRAGDD